MLTYLFKDWVMNETDLETLKVSKQFIRKREIEITGHVRFLVLEITWQILKIYKKLLEINYENIWSIQIFFVYLLCK